MIERQKKKYNWEFLFLGANIDAIKAAEGMGIDRDRAANFHSDAKGTALNYRVLEKAVSCARRCPSAQISSVFAEGVWKEEIDQDFKARG